jgi:hypothetical protein
MCSIPSGALSRAAVEQEPLPRGSGVYVDTYVEARATQAVPGGWGATSAQPGMAASGGRGRYLIAHVVSR